MVGFFSNRHIKSFAYCKDCRAIVTIKNEVVQFRLCCRNSLGVKHFVTVQFLKEDYEVSLYL